MLVMSLVSIVIHVCTRITVYQLSRLYKGIKTAIHCLRVTFANFLTLCKSLAHH